MRKNLMTEPICRHCSLMCDLINVAKVDFFEFASFMMQHPWTLARLTKKISDLEAFI